MMEDYIEKVIAPKIQGDGGWIEYVRYTNSHLTVRMRGECSKCNIATRCIDWIKKEIKREFGEDIDITMIRTKPYFWDLQM